MTSFVFIFFFVLYVFTSAPFIHLGDSGGLSAAAYSLGPAHPPGYFLYVMLGKFASLVPFGNIAQRLSMLSAFLGAASASLVYLTVLKTTGSRNASWFATTIAFLSQLLWSQSVAPEVYTLNLLISASVFYPAVYCISKPDSVFRCVILSFFLIGLGTANHHTILLMAAAPIYVFIVDFRRISDKFRLVSMSFIFFVSGALANIGVYLRGQKDILYNHSIAEDIPGFLSVLFRKQYTGDTVSAIVSIKEASGWLRGITNGLSFVLSDTWYFLPVLIAGIAALYMKKRRHLYLALLIVFVWTFLLGTLTASALNMNPEQRFISGVFFIPLFIPLCLLWGAGFAYFEDIKLPLNPIIKKYVFTAVSLLPALLMLPENYPKTNLTLNNTAYYYARDMLSVLPTRSVLVTGGDNPAFTTSYLKAVERYREDVILAGAVIPSRWFLLPEERGVKRHPLYQDFYDRGWWISTSELHDMQRAGYKAFFTHEETMGGLKRDFKLLFYGPVFKVVPKGSIEWELEDTAKRLPSIMDRTNYEALMEVPDYSKDYFSWIISYRYSDMLIRYGYIEEQREAGEALRYYEAAYRLSPMYDTAKSIYEDRILRRGLRE